MDNQMPGGSDAYSNSNLFADNNPQYHHAYDNLFSHGADQSFNDPAAWAVNGYPTQQPPSRASQASPSWSQNNANHHVSNPNVGSQPSPYSLPVSQSPASFAQGTYGQYNPPQGYQYRQPPPHQQQQQQQPQQRQQFDPALFNTSGNVAEFNQNYASFNNHTQNVNNATVPTTNVTYTPVDQPQPSNIAVATPTLTPTPAPSIRQTVDQKALAAAVPKGNDANGLSIINFEELAQATNSARMGNFINIGKETLEWPINRSTALPYYTARKSVNGLRQLVGDNTVLLARIAKKSTKKQSSRSKIGSKPASKTSVSEIKYDGQSSDDSSSDDDDSSYSSESEDERPPGPDKTPTNPKEIVEFDTIRALWRSKRKPLESSNIRKGLTDFWEIVKTIRDRWKADTNAVQDAEEKKRTGELPLLKSRVKDQRDMIESAFKTALKHGHRSIIELLAENVSLIFLCYQFLLDRFKEDDVNGPLARAMLETLTLFSTLTEEKLEKTHLVKVLPRYVKKGDAKTQFYAKKIISNAAAATKERSGEATTNKPASAGSPKQPEAEPVTGMKRAASNAGEGGAQKKIATTAKPNGTTVVPVKSNGVVKKPLPPSLANKTAANTTPASAPTAAPVKKTVVAKPSTFFSSLQSATKKPGTSIKGNAATNVTATAAKPAEKKAPPAVSTTPAVAPKPTFSFAETMANLAKPKEEPKPAPKRESSLPPETSEAKAKRLRKEARRKLHVHFKPEAELVQIKYFHHDPEEELGHNSSQMRDVADVGGEGRMLKMHMMDVDEEDDGSDDEMKSVEFPPKLIDFSVLPADERERMYAPYGGGDLVPESSERAVREQYEANTLLVIYTDPNDIPPNPREPIDPYNGLQMGTTNTFGMPEDSKLLDRLNKRKSSNFGGMGAAPTQMYNQAPAQQAAPAINPDIQAILARLQAVQPPAQQAPQVQAPAFAFPPVQQPAQAAPPTLDLAAIIASVAKTPQANGFGNTATPSFQQSVPQPTQASSFQDFNNNQAARSRPQQPENVPYNYKTRTCNFWRKGTCTKGDKCTFAHEEIPGS